MALAFAARLERASQGEDARIERAFRLAYGRAPEAREREMAMAHLARQTAHHRATAPPAKPEKRPIVHQITSELTGETFRFVQQEDPAPYEENLHRRC
jgi:hypothetical protein